MTTDVFGGTSDPDIKRDRWGRPLINPPAGGKPIGYTRVSTLAKALEDTENLRKWAMRMAMLGVVAREDIYAAVSVLTADNKGKLNDLAEKALEAAKGTVAREVGTALHTMTEELDHGRKQISDFPRQYQPSLQAYRDALEEAGLEPIAAEVFVVNDELRCAGTLDRLLRHKRTGRVYCGDVKTGNDHPLYSMFSTEIQVATYARSFIYVPATGERLPLANVDLEVGCLIHLPQSQQRCELIPLNLERGWQGARLATAVRSIRNVKKPDTPWTAVVPA